MTKLSAHFSSQEFACKCGCGQAEVHPKLIELLEHLRAHFNQPVIITSGRRCEKHNKHVGGAKNSQHLLGTAADINIKHVTPKAVADYLESTYPDSHGIGRYKTFTHIDVRHDKARWGKNT